MDIRMEDLFVDFEEGEGSVHHEIALLVLLLLL